MSLNKRFKSSEMPLHLRYTSAKQAYFIVYEIAPSLRNDHYHTMSILCLKIHEASSFSNISSGKLYKNCKLTDFVWIFRAPLLFKI